MTLLMIMKCLPMGYDDAHIATPFSWRWTMANVAEWILCAKGDVQRLSERDI